MTDSTDEDVSECHQCGDTVGPSADQRVVTTVEDGTAVYQYFCNDECFEAWELSSSA
ncbi:DUF7576 family protein [Natrinema halophilum]|uniref:TRASH domain-containing protein n=1 Tax=Natrinema halophilum TaxID=1699371 RepID=A0A7D5L057_9EURY|nr:hypothetical protein [Natrinema halophilum]QLG50940.1 hypothetical protein HYG82_19930 [Natrinema halophilum]